MTVAAAPVPASAAPLTLRRLAVVTHVPHFRWDGQLHAYAAYAREIDVWAELFPEVVIAAPVIDGPPPSDSATFENSNIRIEPQSLLPGGGLGQRLLAVLRLPAAVYRLGRVLRSADAVQVRVPGNTGLIGTLLAPWCCRHLVAKYTGQWQPFPGEAWSWRLQRWLLRSWFWPGVIAVYGQTTPGSTKEVGLFTSIMTRQQMEQARVAATHRQLAPTPTVSFVGRLSPQKNVNVLIRAVAALRQQNKPVRLRIVGEGEERSALEALTTELGIVADVDFVGGAPFEKVLDLYPSTDVLVLASQTESWGKAITEAMAFGVVCIGSNRGLMPTMLADGRGKIVEPRDIVGLTAALADIIADPRRYAEMSRRSAAWGQQYSLEGLRESFRQTLQQHWGVTWPSPTP